MTENTTAKPPDPPTRAPPPSPGHTDNGPSPPPRAELPASRATKDADATTPIPKPAPQHTKPRKTRLTSPITHLRTLTSRTAARLAAPARAVAKVAGITGFAVACVALWSTLVTMDDGHRAVTLAEWTARKDFLEYCRENDYQTPVCERASNLSLGPPPRFFARSLSECAFDLLDRDALLSSLRDEGEGEFSWEPVGPGCGWRWVALDLIDDEEGVCGNCSGGHGREL